MDLYQNYSTADFHRKSQTVASNILKISQNVSSMQKLVALLSSGDNSSTRKQLHEVTHYTGNLAKDTSEDLKELNKYPIGDQRQLKLQREKLTSDFSTVLNSFQTIQRTAASKEKELMRAIQDEEQQPNLVQFRDPPTSKQIFAEEENVSELVEREKSIRQLETDILSVNQIFQELAKMVHEQGDVVDSIEAHVEEAQIGVHEGVQQLSQAATYQNKARRNKFYIFMILAIVIIILVLIIYYTS